MIRLTAVIFSANRPTYKESLLILWLWSYCSHSFIHLSTHSITCRASSRLTNVQTTIIIISSKLSFFSIQSHTYTTDQTECDTTAATVNPDSNSLMFSFLNDNSKLYVETQLSFFVDFFSKHPVLKLSAVEVAACCGPCCTPLYIVSQPVSVT